MSFHKQIPVDVKNAITKAMCEVESLPEGPQRTAILYALWDIYKANRRATARQESDRSTDRARRKLVGARIAQKDAKRCISCAQAMGESLYRFVVTALTVRCHDVERSRNLHWDGSKHSPKPGQGVGAISPLPPHG